MGNVDNVVCPPARRSDGKKVDTWKVKLPGPGYETMDVDIYMSRDDDSVYTFHLDIPIGKRKCTVRSQNPSELKDLLNKVVAEEIEKTWDKGLVVQVDTYSNSQLDPEDPGEHELKVEWHIVRYKVINDFLCHMEDGDLFTLET